jgi:hypothetical protein
MKLLEAIREAWKEINGSPPPPSLPQPSEPQASEVFTASELSELERIPSVLFMKLAQFSREYPTDIHTYTHRRLTKAIENDLDRIPVYRFNDNGKVAWYVAENYEVALNDLLGFYMKEQMYERIPHVKELIQTNKINAVIRQSRFG